MNEELAAEDQLRLSVLLTQEIKAIRLDESRMELCALTDKGEASMPLHPTCRSDRYLRLVREVLSGSALGSPGGYPVYLTRWTRHGQMDGANLAKLLLIGEPEAVVAVVHSSALTDELAGYAWWAMPTIENARLMLRRETVARGCMGRVLAEFLAEHLPFLQDDHLAIMDTVSVLIQSECLDQEALHTIWRRGKRSNTYYVPFLEWDWPGMAEEQNARADYGAINSRLGADAEMLLTVSSAAGQAFIGASLEILARPETQEVVSRTLNVIGRFFSRHGSTEQAVSNDHSASWTVVSEDLAAILALSAVSEELVIPVFARSTAIGSLMRKKIEPITKPIQDQLRVLLQAKMNPA